MSKKNQIDLIEDITVEELLADGLVENVEVGEVPSKKDDETTKQPVDMAPENEKEVVAEPSMTKAGLVSAMYQHVSKMSTEELKALYSSMTAPKAEEPKGDAAAAAAVPNPAEKPIETPVAEADAEKGEEESDETETEQPKSDEKETEEVPGAEDKKSEDEAEADSEDDDSEDSEEKDEVKEEKDEDESEEDSEDEDEDEEEMKEDVDLLLNAEKSLSEEFKKNAKTLFEQELNKRLEKKTALIEKNFAERLETEVDSIQTKLAEQVSQYMDYAVQSWVEQNQVAIEHGLRTEIAEGFIESLKNVFKESYITVPEGKADLVESYKTEISKLEGQLTQSIEQNMKLTESVNTLTRNQILSEASKDLASTEAVKLISLTESIDFENSETFTQKVEEVKKSYFRKPKLTENVNAETEVLNEDAAPNAGTSPIMDVYSEALSRLIKANKK